MKTFLKPLSKEEERECLEALGGSDGVKAREAKQKLIERNLRLVAHIAKKYQNVDEDMEDLISIGTIGLIKAVDSFDSAKNSKLATYAARCIDNELLMMLRSKKNFPGGLPLRTHRHGPGGKRDQPAGCDGAGNAGYRGAAGAGTKSWKARRHDRFSFDGAGEGNHLPAIRPPGRRGSDPAGNWKKAGYLTKLCFQNRKKSAFKAEGRL